MGVEESMTVVTQHLRETEQFCMERCQWRRLFNSTAKEPLDFSFSECTEGIELAGEDLDTMQAKCGLAAVCVLFAAEQGK